MNIIPGVNFIYPKVQVLAVIKDELKYNVMEINHYKPQQEYFIQEYIIMAMPTHYSEFLMRVYRNNNITPFQMYNNNMLLVHI